MSSTELEALSNRVDNEIFEGVYGTIQSMANFQSSLVIPLVQRQMLGLSGCLGLRLCQARQTSR